MHPFEFTGETTQQKLQKVQEKIAQEEGAYYFFSSLDEIACYLTSELAILNLRH
ncbi:aminopeptidase P family N-terminal domain-containing protein [Tenacibaculum sp. SG-28]|uniref:aminopeptidase P family N-terminal domain-containing protein n=1 Tax=Tenacibaculum sp. SG-28 TaxID=754426 RepID=UPI003513073D